MLQGRPPLWRLAQAPHTTCTPPPAAAARLRTRRPAPPLCGSPPQPPRDPLPAVLLTRAGPAGTAAVLASGAARAQGFRKSNSGLDPQQQMSRSSGGCGSCGGGSRRDVCMHEKLKVEKLHLCKTITNTDTQGIVIIVTNTNTNTAEYLNKKSV